MSSLLGNKILGAGLTTALLLFGLNSVSENFFHTDEPETPGFLVEVSETGGGEDDGPKWVPPVDYGVLLAEADIAKGQKKAAACATCHKFEQGGGALQGPEMWDIVMRDVGSMDGFGYSNAMAEFPGVWDYAALDSFLQNPKKYMKGTAMNYAGLSKEPDRMNVIAYLRTLSSSPAALPAPLPASAFVPPSEGGEDAETTDAAEPAAIDVPATEGVVEEAALDFTATVGDVEIKAASGGVESRLIAFIESDKEPCTEAECWYSFDRLTFNTGSAELDMAKSSAQLENIVAIMNAFPTVQLKLGGYTDNTGDEALNQTLSESRAASVKQALMDMGIEEERLVTEGYGSQFPIASNETEEGRAQNRRIDVRVRAR